jgi:osmotically-inducible protein OsmY
MEQETGADSACSPRRDAIKGAQIMNSNGMTKMGVATLLVLAMQFGGCANTPTSESAGRFIDDAAITTQVKAKLFADKNTSAYRISVETYQGTVQLSGFVNSNSERNRAAELCWSVADVRAVRNDLVVKASVNPAG